MHIRKKSWDIQDKELLNIIAGRDGGITTIKIIDALLERPLNANKLSTILNLDYNTIVHHTKILCEHKYLFTMDMGRSKNYYPDKKLYKNLEDYKNIKEFLKKKK